jgi:RNA-directed DNA polymerase
MNLESDKRLNIQLRWDFSSAPTGEARQAGREDIESLSVVNEPERPANTYRIMEEVCERANLKEALRQVKSNKGSAGVDRMTVDNRQQRRRMTSLSALANPQAFRSASPLSGE